MEEASQVRRAARETVGDIAPDPFREAVEDALAHGSVAPGVLAVLCARATDREVAFETLAERAAGTQLIYDGLRMTRDLATDPPWERIDRADDAASAPDTTEGAIGAADVAVLVADVLVARGFYLLARTEAAGKAVETVRAFGHDETLRGTDAPSTNHGLEADVFELAAVAGTTAVGGSPPSALCRFVADRAGDIDHEDGRGDGSRLPSAEALFSARTVERLDGLAAPVADGGSTDGNRNR